jgi:hypothetical protein
VVAPLSAVKGFETCICCVIGARLLNDVFQTVLQWVEQCPLKGSEQGAEFVDFAWIVTGDE